MAQYDKLPAELIDEEDESSSDDNGDVVVPSVPARGAEVGSILRTALKSRSGASSSSGLGCYNSGESNTDAMAESNANLWR